MNPMHILKRFGSACCWPIAITAATWVLSPLTSGAQSGPSAGVLQFTRTNYVATERESVAGTGPASADLRGVRVTVTRSEPAKGAVQVDYTIIDGTATNGPGGQYGPITATGTVSFVDFQMSADLPIIPIRDNTVTNADRTFSIALSNARAAAGQPPTVTPGLGTITNTTVTIRDDDAGFNFGRAVYRVRESIVNGSAIDSGVATLTVYLSGTASGDVMIDYRVLNLNSFPLEAGSDYATPDTDFTAVSGTLTFAGGATSQTFDIPIIDDSLVEFNEDLRVELMNPSGKVMEGTNEVDVTVGGNKEATVTIVFDGTFGPRPNGTTFGPEQPAGAVDVTYNPGGPDVSWSHPPFNQTPGANYSVYALAVQLDGKTVIGGDFTAVNTEPLTRIARVDSNGWVDPSFTIGTGVDGPVEAIALYGFQGPNADKILIGGSFTSVNGSQRQGIARLNANGTLDTSFNPGVGADGPVRALAIQSNGKIVMAGDFTTVNGISRNGIARLNADGSVDGGFDPGQGTDGAVWSVALTGVGPTVISSRSAPPPFDTNNMAVGGPAGAVLLRGDFGTETNTFEVEYGTGNIILSNNLAGAQNFIFTFGPGTATNLAIIINRGLTNDRVWNYTATMTVSGDTEQKIVMGGEFLNFDGTSRAGIARLNTDGSLDQTFNPAAGADAPVYALAAAPAGKVFVGGAFSQIGLQNRGGIARLNIDGSVDSTFNPGRGADNAVLAMALQSDGRLLIAGTFRNVDRVRRSGIARLFSYGPLDTSFADTAYNQFAGMADADGVINAIGLQNDRAVMIGGAFTGVGGGLSRAGRTVRFNIARLIGGETPGPGNLEFAAPTYNVDENGVEVSAVLMRTNGILGAVSVAATTRDGLAIAGQDYTASSSNATWAAKDGGTGWMVSQGQANTLTFAPAIRIPIINDTNVEGNETFFLDLSPPRGDLVLGGEFIPIGVALGRYQATVTIVDNDIPPSAFSFSAPTYTVNENGTNLVITVFRSGGTIGSVSVDCSTSDGTSSPAVAGSDYTARTQTLTFASGQTNRTFSVPILNDTIVEPDETFVVTLTNPRGGASLIAPSTAVVTIIDNDYAPGRLGFVSPTFSVNEARGPATVMVRRSGGNVGSISVEAVAFDGTAVSPADFAATNVVLNWADGDTADKSFRVAINNDGSVEGNETIRLRLTNYVTAFPASQSNAVLTIIDDDFYGTLGFSSPTYLTDEIGDSATITVVRSGGIAGTVGVNYATISGTAGTNDYTPVTGTLTFLPGQLSATFSVPIRDDALTEGNENLTVRLSAATGGATLGAPTNATLTIVDNESFNIPAGSLDTSYNTTAGANGAINALALQTNGALIVAGDFTLLNSVTRNRLGRLLDDGRLDASFDPGAGFNGSTRALALQSDGRVIVGGLFTSVNGTNRNRIARINGDGSVDVSFNPGSGADNPVNALAITSVEGSRRVLLGGAFSAVNGTPRSGIARLNDNGSVDNTFDPGTGANGPVYALALQGDGKVLVGGDFSIFDGASHTSLVRLNVDGTVDSTFNIGAGANGSVRALAVQTDGRIVVGGLFTSLNGFDSGHVARLNIDGSVDATFNIGSGADGAVLALATQLDGKLLLGGQFGAFAGVTRGRITRLNSDGSVDPTINFGTGANDFISALVVQPDRKINVAGGFTAFNDQPRDHLARLYGGSLAGSGNLEFTGPLFSANENSTNSSVTVRRTGGTVGTVTVNYTITGGTATQGSDYILTDGVLTFPEGETRQTITIPIINDTAIEGDETVQLQLSSPGGGAFLGNQPTATLTIVSDDSVVAFSSPSFTVVENFVTANAVISVVRTGSVSGTVTVNYRTTTNGTATAGQDFSAVSGTLQFAPGETVKTFAVPIIDDVIVEGNETVELRLSNLTGPAVLGIPSVAFLTINENDFSAGTFNFGLSSYRVAESNSSVTLTVVRTNGSGGAVSVRYGTVNGTATAGLDYSAANNLLAFGDGETSRSVVIPILPDNIVEGNETFEVVLSQPSGGAVLGSQIRAAVTIDDDDFGPGSLDPDFDPGSGANGLVRALVVQPDGRIIIGGSFTRFNETNRNYVARLGANGALDLSFNSGPNGSVFAVGLDSADQDVLIGGLFTTVNGASRNRFARLTSNGATDAVQDQPTALDSIVYALAVQSDSKAFVGGSFQMPKPRLARVRLNGSADTSFNTGLGFDAPVFAITMRSNGELGVGGSFTTFDGAVRTAIAKLLSDGSLDLTFTPATVSGGSVFAVAFQPDGKVVIGGDFTAVGGQSRKRIARFNSDGTLDTGFNPGIGADGPVYGVAIQPDGKVIMAGGFTSISGATRNRIARLTSTGAVDSTFDVGLGANNTVYAISLLPSGKILLAGEFTSVNGLPRNGVARLNGDAGDTLRVQPGFGFSGGIFRLSVNTVLGRRYAVDVSNDLSNWSPLMTNTAAGAVLQFSDNVPDPNRRFYRVREVQ